MFLPFIVFDLSLTQSNPNNLHYFNLSLLRMPYSAEQVKAIKKHSLNLPLQLSAVSYAIVSKYYNINTVQLCVLITNTHVCKQLGLCLFIFSVFVCIFVFTSYVLQSPNAKNVIYLLILGPTSIYITKHVV